MPPHVPGTPERMGERVTGYHPEVGTAREITRSEYEPGTLRPS
jgi:hypothetical protein